MGISKSYNRHNGIYYAYETSYEWSEEKQKKVQKKRCIGQFVPGTNEIIPNGPRGKKSGRDVVLPAKKDEPENTNTNYANNLQEVETIRLKLEAFEEALTTLSVTVHELSDNLAHLAKLNS